MLRLVDLIAGIFYIIAGVICFYYATWYNRPVSFLFIAAFLIFWNTAADCFNRLKG